MGNFTRTLDPESLRASARYYVAHALLAGTTTLIDHHESPGFIEGSLEVLGDACEELGVRALLCYGVTERNGGISEVRRGLRECERFVRENTRDQVRGMIGLHASFTLSDEALREVAARLEVTGLPVHTHLAEDRADVEDARRRGFENPLDRLMRLDVLPPHSILAHGVHADPSTVNRAVEERDAWWVQNPRSNLGNRVGYASSLSATDQVALGTDGYPSEMPEEAKALEIQARANGDAEGLGRARMEAGHRMVASFFRAEDLAGDSVEFEGTNVSHSTIAGRAVVQEGRLVSADLEEIRAHATEQAALLWKRMEAL